MPATGLPLSALLSNALVAFTIEFDNEFEHRMPHSTTRHGGKSGPWLVSLVMYSNCMQFVGEDRVGVSELEELAGTKTNLNGMERWCYITVDQGRIHATAKGSQAREIWRPLFDEIEKRWEERFGKNEIDHLRASLRSLKLDDNLPDCLPILGYGLFSKGLERKVRKLTNNVALPALLSRALFTFAMEFERESELSLAISANVVRILDENGIRVRDLPLLSGVSKEAIAVALGFLEKRGFASTETASGAKVARLSAKGRRSQVRLPTTRHRYRKALGCHRPSKNARTSRR